MALEHRQHVAQLDFERALELDPHQILALVWSGTILLNHGDVSRARVLLSRAVALDPSIPGTIASLAWGDFLAGDYPEAVALSRQMLRAHQLPELAYSDLANAQIELRHFSQARDAIALLARLPGARVQAQALEARVDVLTGHRDRAAASLGRLNASLDPTTIGSWSATALAAAYLALGDATQTRAWLARVALSERPALAHDPRFLPWREDARFSSWLSS